MAERITVRQAKHSTRPRHSGHRNWIVTDVDGQRLVFLDFSLAVFAADQLAHAGSINPVGLVGCTRGDF